MIQHDSDMDSSSSAEGLRSGDSLRRRENLLLLKIIAAVVIAASALIVLYFVGSAAQENKLGNFAVIYAKGDNEFFKSSHEGFTLKTERKSEIKASKDGKRIFYYTKSVFGSNKYDLHCCEVNDKSRIANGGFIIDFALDGGFSVNDAGSFVIYSKKNELNGEVVWNLYDVALKKGTKIESNIIKLFLMPVDNAAYFTKTQNSKTALFRLTFGSTPQTVAASVNDVRLYKSQGEFVLLYESSKENSVTSELYIISGLNEPKLISADVTDVLFEKYKAGGNLFYFKGNKEVSNWRKIIEDDLAQQDLLITKPNKDDYFFFFGYSYGYNRDINKYKEKLSRDELRTALDKLVSENSLISEQLDCYAYNINGSVKIGDSVSPASVYAINNFAEPRIIYDNNLYQLSDIKFSNLNAMLGNTYMSEVTAYASEIIKKSTSSKGTHIASASFTQGLSLDMDAAESKKCEFNFSLDGKALYIFSKDAQGIKTTFYEIGILNDTLAQKKIIDTELTDFGFSGNVLLYLKHDQDNSEGGLYKYFGGNSTKIADSVNSFICFEDSSILLFRNYKQTKNELTADLYCYSNNKDVKIDENVSLNHLRYYNAKDLAYIRNYTEDVGGELCVYFNDKLKTIESGVNEIVFY